MIEALHLLLAGVAGLVLGAVFFGGLHWTLRHGLQSSRPALWLLVSLLGRMSLLLVGLYLVAAGHWLRLLVALVAVIGARWLILRLTATPVDPRTANHTGVAHAPDAR